MPDVRSWFSGVVVWFSVVLCLFFDVACWCSGVVVWFSVVLSCLF